MATLKSVTTMFALNKCNGLSTFYERNLMMTSSVETCSPAWQTWDQWQRCAWMLCKVIINNLCTSNTSGCCNVEQQRKAKYSEKNVPQWNLPITNSHTYCPGTEAVISRLFAAYLTTLFRNSETYETIQRQIKGWQVNSKLERMWEEAVVS
jgi:hypothetical protein